MSAKANNPQHQQQSSAAATPSPGQPQQPQQGAPPGAGGGGGGGVGPGPSSSAQQRQPPSSQQQAGAGAGGGGVVVPSETPPPSSQQQQQPLQPRFEDLTIDDDLPLLPRLQRYVQSSIALQRLVHVRMLGEVALEIGPQLTATELVPLLPPLVKDGESIIRQRLCAELKVLCLVLMGMTVGVGVGNGSGSGREPSSSELNNANRPPSSQRGSGTSGGLPQIPKPAKSSKYYKVMVHHLFPHLFTLISDPDNEVRRAASENIVKLALRVDESDVVTLALSIPLRLVKEGQKRAMSSQTNNNASANNAAKDPSGASASGAPAAITGATHPQTPAEDLLITASNLLADLASFLPPPRLPPDTTARYLSPTVLALAEDPNFRVRRAAVQALPRMLGSATLDDVKRRLLPRFVALSGDEMYRVRKASGECLVDVSRALGVLPWRIHFGDVWRNGNASSDPTGENAENAGDHRNRSLYRLRTKKQIGELHATIHECHEIRRRALCAIAKKLLEDSNKFVRYGMMQFLGPLIASFYPLDRGSMVGGMGGLLYPGAVAEGASGGKHNNHTTGTLGMGVESVGVAKCSTGLERVVPLPPDNNSSSNAHRRNSGNVFDGVLSYNHSLHGLELILHGESPLNRVVLPLGGGCNANKDPFGTMGPQFFPHANGMVGRSSALDDDDTDSFLLTANSKKKRGRRASMGDHRPHPHPPQRGGGDDPRELLPKFLLESRSDALALARIVWHRTGRIPTTTSSGEGASASTPLPYPPLMSGRPDPEDLKLIANSLLIPFVAMASCQTGEETTDAEMRVYCAYSLPAVILLFGGMNWEKDGLKRCFLDLVGTAPKNHGEDNGDGAAEAGAVNNFGPPLPVKRCLASSVHAVAHMLGPDIVSKDPSFLAAFERAFLRDPDEAIRLNVLKNLASFLGALPPGDGPGRRNSYLPVVHGVIMGEDVLGAAKRRSASNPGVLNWRQRDAVARVLPDLIVLFDAELNREFLWPVLRTLLMDSVSAVRENSGWSVPVLLRKYCAMGSRSAADGEMESVVWMSEVTAWLRETFLDEGAPAEAQLRSSLRRLKKQMTSSEGAFSKRQGYCRILAAVALAMRMGEGDFENNLDGLESLPGGSSNGMPSVPVDPFGRMSLYERERFRSLLLRDLLPPALEMAVDCVANVRLTLTKCLKMLPADIQQESHVEEVLSTLEEELMTWDVGDMPLNDINPGGILGGIAAGSLSDPPEAKGMGAGGIGSSGGSSGIAGVVMTSTMSAC